MSEPALCSQRVRSVKYCLVCFDPLSPGMYVEACLEDGSFTQFGSILHGILKFSCCTFRTRFCCAPCSDQVVECFSNVLQINISALLSMQRVASNTLDEVLDEGCVKCAAVLPTLEEFSDHYLMHFYENYKGLHADVATTAEEILQLMDEEERGNGLGRKRLRVGQKPRVVRKKKVANRRISIKDEQVERIRLDAALNIPLEALPYDFASPADWTDSLDYDDNIDTVASVPSELPSNDKQADVPDVKHNVELIEKDHCYGRDVPDCIESAMGKENELTNAKSDKPLSPVKTIIKTANNESRVCELCGNVMNTKISMRNHMLRHRKNADFPRNGARRPPATKVKRPRKMENLECNPILCPKCGKVFMQNYQLQTHMVLMHKADPKTCKKMRLERRYRLWSCSVCKAQFPCSKLLQKHIDKDHDGLSNDLKVQCEPCGRWYKNSKQLSQHISLKHADVFPFSCPHCKKPYLEKRNLDKHIASRRCGEREQTEVVAAPELKSEAAEPMDAVADFVDSAPGEQPNQVYETYLIYLPPDSSQPDSTPYIDTAAFQDIA